mmetsp:Transcript_8509/g.6333  ORF Transcript_8509/g.6333 Transcript_8509/m.6333 type:complete len:193 (+) Transcript_8509:465-1043(+)
MLSTGFPDWTIKEYQSFIKAIRKTGVEDVMSIVNEVDSKSLEEVQQYLSVYMKKFRGLKEKELILRKMNEKNFEEHNAKTIAEFESSKSYSLFMQDNHYYNHHTYLQMMEREHLKIQGQKVAQSKEKNLQLKIDHYFYASNAKILQEVLKYTCIAVRAEDCLRSHLKFMNERKRMREIVKKHKDLQEEARGI